MEQNNTFQVGTLFYYVGLDDFGVVLKTWYFLPLSKRWVYGVRMLKHKNIISFTKEYFEDPKCFRILFKPKEQK